MNLTEKIKTHTKSDHQSVEKVLIGELKNLTSLTQYADLLKRMYTFFQPVEERVHEIIDASLIPDIEKRKHIPKLYKDIKQIDKNFEPTTTMLPMKIDDASYALGVLYVMEGSTMGGQFIAKMLDKKLETASMNADNYFNSYDKETHEMWANFKESLLNNEHKIDEKRMFQGAKDTFSALENHLKATKV